jgi:hypothetical protein
MSNFSCVIPRNCRIQASQNRKVSEELNVLIDQAQRLSFHFATIIQRLAFGPPAQKRARANELHWKKSLLRHRAGRKL